MTIQSSFPVSRRSLLTAGAGLAVGALMPFRPVRAEAPGETRITPGVAHARLSGANGPETDVWCYNGAVPGPVVRLRQGAPARLVVENRLEQDTTVHWHGIRLSNAMDGMPGLTQPPIKPGERFAYEFTPPDAGTFWYHPHVNGLEQLGRGLAGVLIVEEREPVAVDRDLVWMLSDWRLGSDDQIVAGFGNRMEAMMSGRVGNLVTLNGVAAANVPVRAGERLRLRLVNGSLARMMALRFEGHRPVVLAIDGQACDPHEPDAGRLFLGPAMRIDVVLDMQGDPGGRYAVTDDFYDDLAYTLTNLAYAKDAPLSAHPFDAPLRLRPNPLPEPDLEKAERHEIMVQGGMMGAGMMQGMGGMNGMASPGMDGGASWSINGMSMTGDGEAGMAPLLTFARGSHVVLELHNHTAWWHPMHLHDHSFKLLSRKGSPVPYRQWQDTVLIQLKSMVECAFVADNPGDWMLHCHVMDHQASGLMTILRVL